MTEEKGFFRLLIVAFSAFVKLLFAEEEKEYSAAALSFSKWVLKVKKKEVGERKGDRWKYEAEMGLEWWWMLPFDQECFFLAILLLDVCLVFQLGSATDHAKRTSFLRCSVRY